MEKDGDEDEGDEEEEDEDKSLSAVTESLCTTLPIVSFKSILAPLESRT